ncbi:patatin-like phospholipase family protein [Calidifontibacillus oryziterrae]|uniref:patatin-like phospholipase family protein n=1 Tax=Calidifontibacillus oryziterrae TaxID=1191699 RepID=UPI0002DC6F4F|nr:patatin-like phospholipase family protein [Calidifontibacillus oryziterrae]
MKQPTIGLALGSGGARGFAHLGVLKVLKDENIPIDFIAGSSMGALVGGFFGAGHDMDRLYKLATAFRRKYYLDFTVPKMGFISGQKVKEFIRVFTKDKAIEQLSPALAIVATDLKTGEKVIFKNGPLAKAIKASISIPGIFVPEKIHGRLLVDGGVVDRVPVSVVREMGADIVIAVDVSHVKGNVEITSILDVILQSIDIMQDELARLKQFDADIIIRPKVEKYSAKAFTNTEEIIKIGEDEARKQLPMIVEAIKKWSENHHE